MHLLADVAGYFVAGEVTTAGGVKSLTPYRLLDTREGSTGPLAGFGTRTVPTAGPSVPSGVSAVVVNLTAVTPTMAGYLSAYPTGGAVPNASNLNFNTGQVVPNLVFVKVAADGSFVVRNGSPGKVEVVVDIAGYVFGGTPGSDPGMYRPLSPARLLDTRPGYGGTGPLAPNGVKSLTVAGVPVGGVSAVIVNVTVVPGGGEGYLTVYPADAPQIPWASNLNFPPSEAVANLVAAKTSVAGAISLYNGSAASTNVIVDLAGYFT
jgi:hypothetical protein